MSCNFHDTFGSHQGGVDPHNYNGARVPHAAGIFYFFFPMATLHKKAIRVTSEGHSMLQQGYDFYFVAHVPGNPTAALDTAHVATVIANSGSKLWMAVQSVTSGGNPLACSVKWMFGCNQNCGDPIDVPTNVTFQLNSVRTNPTWGDYAGAFAAALLDAGIAAALGFALEKTGLNDAFQNAFKHVFRRAPDAVPLIEDLSTKPVQQWVKQAVDGAL